MQVVGESVQRKEAWDKVCGKARYNADSIIPAVLHAKMLTSTYAHAKILNIDISEALSSPGVRAILLGEDYSIMCGTVIEDRPPIAKEKVRYFGEPVAVVVAEGEQQAEHAVNKIKIEYEPLPVVNSPSDAIKANAPLIHENLMNYTKATKEVYPKENSNISNAVKIRKGDIKKGWSESSTIVEGSFTMPQSDHLAMETRNSRAEILADGTVVIHTSSQSPFSVKKLISKYFNVEEHKVIVDTPLVGGGFGGKAPMVLETIAYMASKAVGGYPVIITNTREEDMVSSPCKLGLEAKLKLGADKNGIIKAAEMTFLVDGGAYADIAPRMTKAIAVDCSGPYNIANLNCDAICAYTNHPYATSFRSFGHVSYTFCLERMLDKLAAALDMDPIELRLKNALSRNHFTPTQVKVTLSNVGSLAECLLKLRGLINWEEGTRIEMGNGKVRAKGVSCFWKTSDSPTDAISGVILTFNSDGSINLNSGAVEIGPGMKTNAAQILAEKLKMDINKINVVMNVNTQVSPEHWKTVASMTTYMLGRAVLRAAEDLIQQLKEISSVVLRCSPEVLEVANERVYLVSDPSIYVAFKDIALGYKYQDGNSIKGQIIARGSFIMSHLTQLDPETGKGKPGPAWAVGAQAVEVEYDKKDHTYRLVKAATVIDAGKVINPMTTKGLIMGGMSMGFGVGSREEFIFDDEGKILNTSLRTYKLIRFGENPEYIVDFVETPQLDAPYGARGLSEHGIIGIPSALGNALSVAAEAELDQLPLTPEYIWKVKTGGMK